MTEAWDEVRVIATDAKLPSADRATLQRAADEFNDLARLYLVMQANLIEACRQRDALSDQLREARRQQPPTKWAYSSGWMPVTLI